MKKVVLIVLFIFSSLTSFQLHGFSKNKTILNDYSSNKRRLVKKIRNRKDNAEYIRAKSKDFSSEDFSEESLSEISFKYSNFESANFEDAFVSSCDFKGANLKNTNFTNAKLLNIENLENAKSVKNANFQSAKLLTNEQKEFLRQNGAKNVPENKSASELISEIEVEQRKEVCNGIAALIIVGGIGYGLLQLLGN